MVIEYRGIVQDRFDTPFGVGTLIWAKDCHNHCEDCFHQDRFVLPILKNTEQEILDQVCENKFSQGVILGGFEWTEDYESLLSILDETFKRKLQCILYTHCTLDEISEDYEELLHYKGLYIKCGPYDNTKLDPTYTSYNVSLASTNQIIYKVGVDIAQDNVG